MRKSYLAYDFSMGGGGFAAKVEQKHNATLFGELRTQQRMAGERLDLEGSRRYLEEGNRLHIQLLREAHAPNPMARFAHIEKNEADGLVIGCSDARVPSLDSENPKSPLLVSFRIAGNVLPQEGSKAFEDMKSALGLVKEGGTVTFVCHCNCGAVAAKKDFDAAKQKPHVPEEIGALFNRVHGTTPADNACKQLAAFKSMFSREIAAKKLELAAVEYSWHAKEFMLVEGSRTSASHLLVEQWNHSHDEVRRTRPNLAQELEKQTPHAIVVAPPTMPYTVSTIFRAEQNELFSTTATKDGLDVLDKASVLYALEHLHTRHIVFVAPGIDANNNAIAGMFEKWKNEITTMINSVPSLAALLARKEIQFTGYRYDVNSGRTVELARN